MSLRNTLLEVLLRILIHKTIVLFRVFPQIASTSDVSTLDADETLNFLSECVQNVTLSVSSLLFYLLDVVTYYHQSQAEVNRK